MQSTYDLLIKHQKYLPTEVTIETPCCSLSSYFILYLRDTPYRIRVDTDKLELSLTRIDSMEIDEKFKDYDNLKSKLFNSNTDFFTEICCLCAQIKSINQTEKPIDFIDIL